MKPGICVYNRVPPWAGILGLCLMLCACVAPGKIQKAQQDEARYKIQSKERDNGQHCTDSTLPGTPEHLACRLGVAAPSSTPIVAR